MRKHPDATMVAAFLSYKTEREQKAALSTLPKYYWGARQGATKEEHQSKQQSHQTHQAPQTLKGPWFWVNKVKLMKTKCPHLYLLHQLMELLRRHLAQVMANEFHEGSCRGRGLWVDPTYHGLLMDEDGDTYSANCPCCTLKCAVCYEETWFYIFPFILCFHLFEL